MFETAQLLRKLEFDERKRICTQRVASILKMHEKLKEKQQKKNPNNDVLWKFVIIINFTVNHAALQLNVDNSWLC